MQHPIRNISGVVAIAIAASFPTAAHAGTTVGIRDASTVEGRALRFVVTLSSASSHYVFVDYKTVEGSADDSGDYVARAGTLRFAPGRTKRFVHIAANTDGADEPPESMSVVLGTTKRASLGRTQATGTIEDTDGPPVMHLADATAAEGDDLPFEVGLSAPSGFVVTANLATSDSRAPVTFEPGSTSQIAAVPTSDDDIDGPDRTVDAWLEAPSNATLGRSSAVGTVSDDDEVLPAASVDDASATEGPAGSTSPMTFDVRLSSPATGPTTVDFTTTAGTASDEGLSVSGGNDFTHTSGTVRFETGETSGTIAIPVNGDDADELDSETFVTELVTADGATIDDGQAAGTITDDDEPPTIWIDDAIIKEPASGEAAMTFTVSLSAPSGLDVAVDYATADDTARSPADYTGVAGTLHFTPGATAQTFDVTIRADNREENGERFLVDLAGAANASLLRTQAIGKIRDND